MIPGKKPRQIPAWVIKVVVFILWLATSALGLFIVGISREIVYGIYARFATDVAVANLLGQGALFLMALIWLAYAFGTAEYHWKNAGKSSSWMVFAWATAIELLLLILYFVVAG